VRSLRARLLLVLIASTSAIWMCGFAWITISSQREIQNLLDRRLMEAARMVLSLSAPAVAPGGQSPPMMASFPMLGPPSIGAPMGSGTGTGGAMPNGGKAELAKPELAKPELAKPELAGRYERWLSCQVWSFDGRLVGRSGNAPRSRLTDQKTGFSEPVVDGEVYRVYAAEDPVKGVRVLVGDNLGQRQGLVDDLLRGLLVPAAVILPLIAVLIWLSVRQGLLPLQRATESLSARDADNLTPLDVGRSPSEIRPLINALNELFQKVVAARDRERSFLAYAAHELRTPLAGLKTQAQVAVKAVDPRMRNAALGQVVKGVDRTSRLVRQLMAMSRLDASSARHADEWIDLEAALVDVTLNLDRELNPGRVAFGASVCGRSIAIDRVLFDLAARNLLENALQLSPANGTVRLSTVHDDQLARICIEDDGPGIPEDELDQVQKRFFRGRYKSASGSGLGLAIVSAALDRAGAELRLGRPDSGCGLRAEIVLPADRLRLEPA
jgi:two-component system sensor histidine kinase QseC